jgi:hypothetical protein
LDEGALFSSDADARLTLLGKLAREVADLAVVEDLAPEVRWEVDPPEVAPVRWELAADSAPLPSTDNGAPLGIGVLHSPGAN